jgi:hypothetical protein
LVNAAEEPVRESEKTNPDHGKGGVTNGRVRGSRGVPMVRRSREASVVDLLRRTGIVDSTSKAAKFTERGRGTWSKATEVVFRQLDRRGRLFGFGKTGEPTRLDEKTDREVGEEMKELFCSFPSFLYNLNQKNIT